MQRLWRATIKGIRAVLALLIVGIILTTSWGVITRYLLDSAASWTGELATYMLVWITFLGSGLAVIEGGHMNFDLILESLPPTARKIVKLLGNFALLYFTGVLTYYGSVVMLSTITDHALTMPISKGFFYAALPVGGLVMVIGYLLDTIKIFKKIERETIPEIIKKNVQEGVVL